MVAQIKTRPLKREEMSKIKRIDSSSSTEATAARLVFQFFGRVPSIHKFRKPQIYQPKLHKYTNPHIRKATNPQTLQSQDSQIYESTNILQIQPKIPKSTNLQMYKSTNPQILPPLPPKKNFLLLIV